MKLPEIKDHFWHETARNEKDHLRHETARHEKDCFWHEIARNEKEHLKQETDRNEKDHFWHETLSHNGMLMFLSTLFMCTSFCLYEQVSEPNAKFQEAFKNFLHKKMKDLMH